MKKDQSGVKVGETRKSVGAKPGRAKAESALEPPQTTLVAKTMALTPSALNTLERFAREVMGKRGRKTSASAIVRALLRYADKTISSDTIASLVDSELASGEVIWGVFHNRDENGRSRSRRR
jgi:hypothetical protein